MKVDYSKMTQRDFDECLEKVVGGYTSKGLLAVSGIYEILSEHFNNEVLDLWEEMNSELAYGKED
jgi:hypothetical protein